MQFKSLVILITVLLLAGNCYAQGKDINIAMLVWRGETPAEQGFRDGLKELGYNADIKSYNAEQDKGAISRNLRQEVGENLKNLDYIYTFGTTVAKITRQFTKDRIPHIFNIVSAPVKSGIVKSMDATGGNVCGVTSHIPLELQIDQASKLKSFKKLAMIFNSREKNSKIILAELKQLAAKSGFDVVELRTAPGDAGKKQLENHLQSVIDGENSIDAVYLPNDSFLVSNAKMIGEKLKNGKVYSIGANKAYIMNGATIGVTPDYYELGKIAASILDRHQKGEKLEAMKVQTTKKPALLINKASLEILGLTVPEELKNSSTMVD